MTTDVFNKQNKKIETTELPEKIFGIKWNPNLVHQALMTQLANRREPIAHAKGRGEVRGGGKKPWRQKGTGRSRHGSIRSPIWKGGGATHGPNKERNFGKKINKKANRLAIFSILSKKLENNEFKLIDDLKIEPAKSKNAAMFLKKIFGDKPNALLIASTDNRKIKQLVSNIKNIDAIGAKSLNIYDLLKYKNILSEKKAVKEMEECYI
ncbi:MAG: 50S ribosomal protein L4 [Patescibacteria group bacterium]